MSFEHVLAPIDIKGMEVRNRFVVPAMGSNLGNPDGTISERSIEYYRARARGGFGLIIVEGVALDHLGKAVPHEGYVIGERYQPGLRRLAKAIHDEGAKCLLQIHHAGRQTNLALTGGDQPVAPSRVACPVDDTLPRELTTAECWEYVEKFAEACLWAKRAGFDGVDLHGAHGYMIAQFMSEHANKRVDEFGGTFEGRMRFPLEVVRRTRELCGDDFVIGFRFSHDEHVPGGRTLEESLVVSHLLEEAGVDLLDVSVMTYASTEYMSASQTMPSGYNMFPTEVIKRNVSIPVIAVGRFNNLSLADEAVRTGRADMIALGRSSLADPEVPRKLAEGRLDEVCPCISCTQSCLGYILSPEKVYVSCLVNPVCGHEFEYDLSPVDTPKRVLVAGAGPAGLVAAMTLARRGHQVVLAERSGDFGGQFRLAAVPPAKQEIAGAIRYWSHMCQKLGVDIRLNTEVTEDLMRELAPQAIVLATGGEPLLPPIPGIDNPKFLSVEDVLDGRVSPGRNVLVCGGGMSGVETADFVAEHFRAATIIEMRPDIALDEEYTPRVFLMRRLEERKVRSVTSARITQFHDDGVDYEQDGEARSLRGFDTVVLAMGVRPHNPLEGAARELCDEVYVVGDALRGGPANKATEEALAAALAI